MQIAKGHAQNRRTTEATAPPSFEAEIIQCNRLGIAAEVLGRMTTIICWAARLRPVGRKPRSNQSRRADNSAKGEWLAKAAASDMARTISVVQGAHRLGTLSHRKLNEDIPPWCGIGNRPPIAHNLEVPLREVVVSSRKLAPTWSERGILAWGTQCFVESNETNTGHTGEDGVLSDMARQLIHRVQIEQ